ILHQCGRFYYRPSMPPLPAHFTSKSIDTRVGQDFRKPTMKFYHEAPAVVRASSALSPIQIPTVVESLRDIYWPSQWAEFNLCVNETSIKQFWAPSGTYFSKILGCWSMMCYFSRIQGLQVGFINVQATKFAR
ncbi:Unknown protein, partial [Striga hermonthica]